ncbi:2-amino-4-hydroxy-6-hydroxymethyldihydropteridine diphosphokinase [Stutzerimonas tarimensis]|uniref:2-amino-4-hydroxy-6-hydroxymethyldihydropteridine diphosphokinase n=1 Tax=Stutzerimonas tarimensis TaxID=1507735 RepID=A0ABV7T8A8_9GAMM
MTPVLLGLGSNVEREKHLSGGLDALATILVDMRCSPVFESLAVGYKGANFYNLAVAGLTTLPLMALDRRLKFIEADNGRYAADRKGLPLDIDVLAYGDLVGNFDGLVLPRAEILRNAFVLWPLALLVPDQRHPGEDKAYADLWGEARIEQALWPAPFEWQGQALTPDWLLEAHTAP